MNETAADAELLVSELVTNAVKATAYQQQAAIRLQLSSDNTWVRAEVWDADPRPPVLKDGTPDLREEGGRGLFLVAALSSPLGLVPHPEATRQGRMVRAGSQIRTAGITSPAPGLPPSPMIAAAHLLHPTALAEELPVLRHRDRRNPVASQVGGGPS